MRAKKRENSGFFERVYALAAQIPPGRVATYGQLALLAGRPDCAIIVGYAMAAAPGDRGLPCHRVVGKNGNLAPERVFKSRDFQRGLLQSEGVAFLPCGRIDMAAHLWRPAPEILQTKNLHSEGSNGEKQA